MATYASKTDCWSCPQDDAKKNLKATTTVDCVLKKDDDECEVKLKVPAEMASLSLGYVIDDGGSVAKIIYRSNKDYSQGMRLHSEDGSEADPDLTGVLRLRLMPRWEGRALIEFLKSHCDIATPGGRSEQNGGSGRFSEPPFQCYHTGVGVQHYIDELNKSMNIKTLLMAETNAMMSALKNLYPTSGLTGHPCPYSRPPLGVLPPSIRAIDRALADCRTLLTVMSKGKEVDAAIDSAKLTDMALWAEKLMTSSGESLQEELRLKAVNFPCLLVSISSGMPTLRIDADGKIHFVDFNSAAGKTILGIGMKLTGAKNFDELVALAERGNTEAVDIMTGDIKNKNRTGDDDFYSIMPENFPVFLMGKLCDEKYEGTYTAADLAAGLLKAYCRLLAKLCLANSRVQGGINIYMAGSFLSSPHVRDYFEEAILNESLTLPFFGGEMVKFGVLEHSGFLCAFGVWQKNLEDEKELRQRNSQHHQALR